MSLTSEIARETEQAPDVPRISVVIVTHNRCATLARSLEALGPEHQVIVVDNGSSDDTSVIAQEFPAVRYIRLPKNFGHTKALNIGIRAADGNYILLLHDDTLLTGLAASQLADYLDEHPEAGAAAPVLLDDAGKPAPQVRPLPTPSNPDPAYVASDGGAAECLLGAAVMYRSYFLRAIRQIDENYGTYGADIELSWQVNKGGKPAMVLQGVKAIHLALPSPVKAGALAADRVQGTAAFFGIHTSLLAGMLYRLTKGLTGLLTFNFSAVSGAFGSTKIDGTH